MRFTIFAILLLSSILFLSSTIAHFDNGLYKNVLPTKFLQLQYVLADDGCDDADYLDWENIEEDGEVVGKKATLKDDKGRVSFEIILMGGKVEKITSFDRDDDGNVIKKTTETLDDDGTESLTIEEYEAGDFESGEGPSFMTIFNEFNDEGKPTKKLVGYTDEDGHAVIDEYHLDENGKWKFIEPPEPPEVPPDDPPPELPDEPPPELPSGSEFAMISEFTTPECKLLFEQMNIDDKATMANQILSPLKQFNQGISAQDVVCKENLNLIIKSTNGHPVCVKPSTAEKLIQRGWAAMPEQNISETPEPIISEVDFSTIINANNQFSLDFYSKVTKDNEDNIFYSPWSISTAFAIAYEGTRGNTADEISQVFGFPTDDNQRRNEFKSAINDLNQKDAKYNMTVANALWIADFFEPIQEYVDTAKTYYDSEVSKVDFVSTEGVKTINEWVKQKTEEKIDEVLVEGSTNELTRLVITNAIYFKGNWLTQFDEENTSDDDFWIGLDENVQVPMMRLEPTYFNYTKTDQLQVLELPYEGDKLSMLVLLPNEKDSLGAVEEELTVENLSRWKDNLSLTETIVFLPKFTLETKYDLIPSLESLGMPTAFQEGVADFSGITELERLYIAQAIHKAFVDVNEEGTEAAAVTAIGIVTTSEPVYEIFKADHPFIFIIQDNETDNILFLGRVINPE